MIADRILIQALFYSQITVEAMKSPQDDVCLQGIEFWSNVCEEEIDLSVELSEVGEFCSRNITKS